MSNSKNRALRLLELYIMLTQESNEEHPLTVAAMRTRLDALDLGCSRKSLYEDLDILADDKVSLEKKRVRNSVGYYSTFGSFSPGELEILFDAVQACSFISPSSTDTLLKKIAGQSGCYDASEMLHSVIRFNTRKQDNPEIFRIIEICARAVREQKRLSFRYFHPDFSGEADYEYDGQPITVDPLFPVFMNDWFYLVAWASDRGEVRHYRVDRIADPAELEIPVSAEALAAMPDPAEYTKRVFSMYGGEDAEVTLVFEKKALGTIFDKFGRDITVTRMRNGRGQITRRVAVSPLFFSWLDQYEGDIRITAPDDVRDRYKAHLRRCLKACK